MSIGINDFTAQFAGGARTSLFRVQQFFPGSVGANGAARRFAYQCKGAQLPGSTVAPIDVMYMGRQIKVAGDRTFGDMTLTVINDTDFEIRTAFENWMKLLNDHESNIGTPTPTDYYADVIIEQLDRDESVLRTYKLINCFPTEISAIDLDWGTTDTVEEYTVTLAMNYWE